MESMSHSMQMKQTVMTPAKRRRTILLATSGVVVLGLWYLFRPELLFINKKVHEDFPTASGNMMPGKMMSEKMESGKMASADMASQARAQGIFHGVAHETKGTAAIYELTGGKHVLRLTGFETSNGPDVHVFLGKAADATDNDTVKTAGYLDLGSLKGNQGDQNYDIPADASLDDYKSVTIWCNRFSVNFGTAPLGSEAKGAAMPMTADATKSLSSGEFHGVAHETKGMATIHQLNDGARLLRLTGFETSNGPDVHVFLAKTADPTDSAMVKDGGFYDLGSLKGNQGDQNYQIPAEVSPDDYHSVVIWCNRFGVNFGAAPLKMN